MVCCEKIQGLKPTLIMFMVQSIFAVVTISYKLATYDGMSLQVLVAYRFIFGAAFILPVAFFVERKKRPKLTKKTVLYGFLCGLFGGALGQNLYLKSLDLTSVTFASAMTNLIPAITFVVAICFGLERLGWNTNAGKAKVLGTLIGISGAMLLTFYKGAVLNLWNTNINLLELTTTHHDHRQNHGGGHNLVLGSLLALASCVSYSFWFIVQAKAAETYPCPYSITAMMTVWASILSVFFALCIERDWSQWILGWNIRLLTVSVAGILGSAVMFPLIAWCVRMRGPLFVSTFNPLLLVLVALGGSLFLEEKLRLGMVLGAVLIVCGLYVVLWGKAKELNKVLSQLAPEENQDPKQVEIDIQPPPENGGSSHGGNRNSRGGNGSSHGGNISSRGGNGSSHGARSSKGSKDEGDDDERRDSQSSEVLSSIYIYP